MKDSSTKNYIPKDEDRCITIKEYKNALRDQKQKIREWLRDTLKDLEIYYEEESDILKEFDEMF